MEIEIGGWKLWRWRPGDEAALVRHANNWNVWINLRDSFPHPYTEADAKAWVASVKDQDSVTSFAIVSAGEAIGGIGLTLLSDVARRSAELSYWLGEPYWGRGIATKAVDAIAHYAFATFDLVRLEAGVLEWNLASVRVLEKVGFTLESRVRKGATEDGKTIDYFLYALVRDEA